MYSTEGVILPEYDIEQWKRIQSAYAAFNSRINYYIAQKTLLIQFIFKSKN